MLYNEMIGCLFYHLNLSCEFRQVIISSCFLSFSRFLDAKWSSGFLTGSNGLPGHEICPAQRAVSVDVQPTFQTSVSG